MLEGQAHPEPGWLPRSGLGLLGRWDSFSEPLGYFWGLEPTGEGFLLPARIAVGLSGPGSLSSPSGCLWVLTGLGRSRRGERWGICLRQALLPGPAAQGWPCSIPVGEEASAGIGLDSGT